MKSRENVLIQLGDYCTEHTCKNCPFKKMAEDHHHGCPEFLRIPELAEQVSQILKNRRTHREAIEAWSRRAGEEYKRGAQ